MICWSVCISPALRRCRVGYARPVCIIKCHLYILLEKKIWKSGYYLRGRAAQVEPIYGKHCSHWPSHEPRKSSVWSCQSFRLLLSLSAYSPSFTVSLDWINVSFLPRCVKQNFFIFSLALFYPFLITQPKNTNKNSIILEIIKPSKDLFCYPAGCEKSIF